MEAGTWTVSSVKYRGERGVGGIHSKNMFCFYIFFLLCKCKGFHAADPPLPHDNSFVGMAVRKRFQRYFYLRIQGIKIILGNV